MIIQIQSYEKLSSLCGLYADYFAVGPYTDIPAITLAESVPYR